MLKAALNRIAIVTCALSIFIFTGCIGPYYTNHELILDGKPPPEIHSPKDPAIEANLSTNAWTKSPLLNRSAEVGVAIFKSAGIQGWKDYHLHAKAMGTVIQHEFSSDGFLTMDLQLKSLMVKKTLIRLPGPRYMRLEIFLGKVSVDKTVYEQTNALVLAQGKLVWDSDGWFEIHPQKTGDVVLAPRINAGSREWPIVP